MAKPFDATTKQLLERHPNAWLEFLLGEKLPPVHVVNADLSTVTSEADKVFRVGGHKPWMVHVELVSSRTSDLAHRIERYNVLVRGRHNLPVQSVIVLLRRKADSPRLTGELEDRLPSGLVYHFFRYNIVRVWEWPVDEILAGNIEILPLAPISRVSPTELPAVLKRMEERFDTEAKPGDVGDLWAATYVLMGLVYAETTIQALGAGVRKMKESVTYQAILREGKAEGKAEGVAEGRIEEAKRILLRQGRHKFGQPKPAVRTKLAAISDLNVLENLSDRILDAENWNELITGL